MAKHGIKEQAPVEIFWVHIFFIGVCAHCEVPPEQVQKEAIELYWKDLETEVKEITAKGIDVPTLVQAVETRDMDKWKIILKGSDRPEHQWPVQCSEYPERIHYMLEAV